MNVSSYTVLRMVQCWCTPVIATTRKCYMCVMNVSHIILQSTSRVFLNNSNFRQLFNLQSFYMPQNVLLLVLVVIIHTIHTCILLNSSGFLAELLFVNEENKGTILGDTHEPCTVHCIFMSILCINMQIVFYNRIIQPSQYICVLYFTNKAAQHLHVLHSSAQQQNKPITQLTLQAKQTLRQH